MIPLASGMLAELAFCSLIFKFYVIMVSFLKKILQLILGFLARKILIKYKPDIIGITGSVGKTSTKEAVYLVLKDKLRVRQNKKNYNNELGVPLTIIGAETQGKSLAGWLIVFYRALKTLARNDEDYPKILILEMGADQPGDIEYLTAVAPCRIGILTAVGPTHLEFFGSVQAVLNEKKIIATHLSPQGFAVINRDDDLAWSAKNETKAIIFSFGLNEESLVRASEINLSEKMGGLSFKLSYKGSTVPVFLPNVLAQVQVYNTLAAAAVGLIYGLNLLEIAQNLKALFPGKSRMRLLNGVKDTQVIDDCYNSSPKAAAAALETLKEMTVAGKKVAVLGDMLELGSATEEEHLKLGQLVAETDMNVLITVGERARHIAHGAQAAGMADDKIFSFSSADEAKKFVQDIIESGDLILIKGSRGMHLEKIVKEIMLEPLRAHELVIGY